MNNNVRALPVSHRADRHDRPTMRETLPGLSEVLQFERPTDEAGILADIAPWMQGEPDRIEMWRSSLFMSRLGGCIEVATGTACFLSAVWKASKGNIRGVIDTPSGKLNIDVWECGNGGHVTFHALRSTLLDAGIAQAEWLHTESRRGRRSEFQSEAFDAQRTVKVTKSGDRYFVRIDLAEEEVEAMRRFERLATAQSDVQREIDTLPKTVDRYMDLFLRVADLQTGAMQMLACESRGGFALDDPSRAAILTQLDSLRQAIYRAKSKFDRGERRSEIACIVQKHAPSNTAISSART